MSDLVPQGEVLEVAPPGMTVDDIRQQIYRAADLRMPRMDKEATLSANVELVQNYLVETAIARSELERARLYAYDALAVVKDQWDDIPREAYEDALTGTRTNVQVDAAKATVAPELADAMRTARRLVDRLSDQIRRLEADDKCASRVFSMLIGA